MTASASGETHLCVRAAGGGAAAGTQLCVRAPGGGAAAASERQEQEAILELYMQALGMV